MQRSALTTDPALTIPSSAGRLIGERVRRRVAREPVAYILARKGFRRLELHVDARVLIPRPETELLVEVALELPQGAWAHEVGTGGGAVALALLDERPDLRVTASERSSPAVEVARANARRLGLELRITVAEGLPADARGCDLVVANLPYVTEREMPDLAPEILLYEPREALVAGSDGLDWIRALIGRAPAGVRLALEHAPHQAETVRGLLGDGKTRTDLAGRERVTIGRAP